MKINLITPLPEIVATCQYGILGHAISREKLILNTVNIRDSSTRSDRRIDDKTYGGGPGMVIEAEPVFQAIESVKPSHVIYLSPEGDQLTQQKVRQLASKPNISIVCGRYEGIDQRAYSHFDEVISIGDYVLSGGDIPALVLIDALARLQPGVMQNPKSHECDSFESGLLDHDHYTKPLNWQNQVVPAVLTSGHHKDIAAHRLMQSLGKTWLNRPDLLIGRKFSQNELALLMKFVQNHNRMR
ncbi:tRNA (guanosine(37)-N1)-methyltransferase TrmD [Gammaproteobacteria bacterium]|nr:tRNA (guanosine(37)-N1)-methyltransferase TrmD [Gammaproteobacteria bacterium]